MQARLLLLREAGVGFHGVVQAGVGAFLFAFVLAAHDAFQRLAQLRDLLPQLAVSLEALVRQHEQAQAAQRQARQDAPGEIQGAGTDDRADADATDQPARQAAHRAHHGFLGIFRQLPGQLLLGGVLQVILGAARDALQQGVAVVTEARAGHLAARLAADQERLHVLPEVHVGLHETVDHAAELPVDGFRQVGHRLAAELFFQFAAVHQAAKVTEPQLIVDETVGANLEFAQEAVDAVELPVQFAQHGFAVVLALRLQFLQELLVFQQGGAGGLGPLVLAVQQLGGGVQRRTEFQAHAFALRETRLQQGTQGREAHVPAPLLLPGADQHHRGRQPQHAPRPGLHELFDLFLLLGRFQQVGFVDHHDHAAAPPRRQAQELPLGLGEGPVGTREKQQQVGAR